MTDEEKIAEEKAKAEADAARAQETDTEKAAREAKEKEDSLKKHYEDELKREREAREKAERAAADEAYKRRNAGKDNEDDEDDEGKPLTRGEIQSILAEERQTSHREILRSRIEERIRSLAGSDTEASLMLEISKTRTFPSHYTSDDIAEEIYAIANRKRMKDERDEALRALRARNSEDMGSASTHHDVPRAGEPAISAIDKGEYARAGFLWNGTSRRYEKKLSNGSMLIKDPATKRVYLVKKSS